MGVAIGIGAKEKHFPWMKAFNKSLDKRLEVWTEL
jgi:hypothetical protein